MYPINTGGIAMVSRRRADLDQEAGGSVPPDHVLGSRASTLSDRPFPAAAAVGGRPRGQDIPLAVDPKSGSGGSGAGRPAGRSVTHEMYRSAPHGTPLPQSEHFIEKQFHQQATPATISVRRRGAML